MSLHSHQNKVRGYIKSAVNVAQHRELGELRSALSQPLDGLIAWLGTQKELGWPIIEPKLPSWL